MNITKEITNKSTVGFTVLNNIEDDGGINMPCVQMWHSKQSKLMIILL